MCSSFLFYVQRHLSLKSGALWRPGYSLVLMLVLLVPGLQSCQGPATRESAVVDLAPRAIAPAARRFRLRTDQSRLTVLVYRDGRLANLGHNHVVSSDDLQGEIYIADTPQDASFEIRVPVATMDVDLPQYRVDAGDDFPGELDPEAVNGTRENMLGAQQLDAEAWPEIVMRSRRVRGNLPDITVQVEIAVRSHVHTVEIPLQAIVSDERIVATGHFQLNQTDLGLEPFSVMMGALKVRDQLDIQFTLVAEADNAGG